MSPIDKTIYPIIENDIPIQLLERYFSTTKDEINLAINNTKRNTTTLCFLICFKIFQYARYFIKISTCPIKVLNYIIETNKFESLSKEDLLAYDMSKQSTRHQQIILKYFDIKPYKKNKILKIAKNIAKAKDTRTDTMNYSRLKA